MFTKSPRYSGQCSYILYFERSWQITLAQLKEVRAVNMTIAKYKSKASRVSPCRRCCCSGYGALNCGNSPRCIVCAGDHIAADCKYILSKHAGGNSQIHVISNVQIALTITVPPSRNVVSDLNTSKLWRRSGQPNPYLPLLMKPPSLRQSTGTPSSSNTSTTGHQRPSCSSLILYNRLINKYRSH